jgi:PKD repeat protein
VSLTGNAPLTVTFSNLSTGADAYLWTFGDGITSTLATPVHTYTQGGLYTVTLTASGLGGSDTLTRANYITVTVLRDWGLITTTTGLSVTGEHAMAYDEARQVVVLYGGNATGWPYEETTWEFDGSDWLTATTTQTPTVRYGAAAAYDRLREVVVLFGGGASDDLAANKTWEFTGTAWLDVSPTTSPLSRTYAAVTADPISGTIYLFGGNQTSAYFNDLWAYDGATWQPITPTGQSPPARTLSAMAYDAHNARLLLFGGRSPTGTVLADLWAFDLTTETWTELNDVGQPPPARQAHTLTYDALNRTVVLVGGADENGDILFDDTWHFGESWAEAQPATTLPEQAYHQVVYDTTNQRLILVGNGEVWSYE